MSSGQSTVLLLAEAVADGERVDWDHAEASAASAEERHVITQLRRLAAVGDAARGDAGAASRPTWGPFVLLQEVGRGTFGVVYRALDPRIDRVVALKLLTGGGAPSGRPVLQEARSHVQIRHPNVLTLYGADVFDGRRGFWMEFVEGRTLKEILLEQGRFGAHEAALIGRDVCRALAAVHRQGLLHRDIKAQNVMREAGGRTVLMDFGAAIAADPHAVAFTGLAGTPAYLAPEVLAGEPFEWRSDLYSVGVLLFYLVSGEFPVVGQSLEELRRAHAEGRRRLLRDVRPDLPAEFVRAVDRATAPDPQERPSTAGEMEQLLEAALNAGEQIGIVRPDSKAAGRNWQRTSAAAAVVVVLAGGLLTGGLLMGRRGAFQGAGTSEGRNSVAILPFRNLTQDDDNDFFSEGITQDLAAHLASLRELRVVSGPSLLRFRDTPGSLSKIATELGVATVLDGSVRRYGDRVRIVSQLLDARTGEQLWSGSFDRDARDVFALQSEVSRKIAIALKGELSEVDAERLRPASDRDAEAFNLYLKGRASWALRTEEGINVGLQYFQEAIVIDPAYAPAYAGLADAYVSLGLYGFVPRSDAFARAAAAAEKAVALDPSLAEAQASVAYVQKNRLEWSAAEASFRRAIELKPGYAAAHHWYSVLLTQQGRFPEAITEIKIAISLDPFSVAANLQLASLLSMARRYDDALAQYRHALQMDEGIASAYGGMADVHALQGHLDKASAALEQARQRMPPAAEDQELKARHAYVLALAGRSGEAVALARELAERYRRTGEEVAGSVAAIYTALRRPDEAFEWLERAMDVNDPEIAYLKVDPRWDLLRGDSRFDALLARLGLLST